MFRGRYEHNLDAKGRLALPAAVRKVIARGDGAPLIITPHISSSCLVVYPLVEWEAFEKRFAELPQFDPKVMAVRRLYVGGAMECPLDKHGRVLIPQTLRDHAAIEREAIWIGGMHTLEIWSPAHWAEALDASRKLIGSDVLEKLGELGI